MKNFLLILILGTVFFSSCEKEDTGTPIWRIWYAVQLTPNFDMDIVYNSDKYYDTRIIDTLHIHDTSFVPNQQANTWIAQHIQSKKDLGYKLNLKIKNLTPYSGRLGVFVYANDTSLLDSTSFPYGTTSVNLEGEIPHVFK